MRIPLSPEDRSPTIASLTSPIDTINIRLEMNKQLLAKDDTIHNLEIRNQNLENEIRWVFVFKHLTDYNYHLKLNQKFELAKNNTFILYDLV